MNPRSEKSALRNLYAAKFPTAKYTAGHGKSHYTERTLLLPLIWIYIISNECSYYKIFIKKMPLNLHDYLLFQHLYCTVDSASCTVTESNIHMKSCIAYVKFSRKLKKRSYWRFTELFLSVYLFFWNAVGLCEWPDECHTDVSFVLTRLLFG